MAHGVNRVFIIGNLGRDPEVRYLANGSAVANITVATSETWKDKDTGQQHEQTEWHRVIFYGRLAEIVGEYLRKGSKVYLEGSIHTRKWLDKQTGQDKYSTEIKGNTLQMLDSKGESSAQQYEQPEPAQAPAPQQRPQSTGYASASGRSAPRAPAPMPADDFDYSEIPF